LRNFGTVGSENRGPPASTISAVGPFTGAATTHNPGHFAKRRAAPRIVHGLTSPPDRARSQRHGGTCPPLTCRQRAVFPPSSADFAALRHRPFRRQRRPFRQRQRRHFWSSKRGTELAQPRPSVWQPNRACADEPHPFRNNRPVPLSSPMSIARQISVPCRNSSPAADPQAPLSGSSRR